MENCKKLYEIHERVRENIEISDRQAGSKIHIKNSIPDLLFQDKQ
jgi:hypothetical protein